MDILQIALVFLIILLSIFLAITGFQVFLILRDLKRALDRLNKVLQTGEEIASDIEKPISAAANLVTTLSQKAKRLTRPKSRRFYKKTL